MSSLGWVVMQCDDAVLMKGWNLDRHGGRMPWEDILLRAEWTGRESGRALLCLSGGKLGTEKRRVSWWTCVFVGRGEEFLSVPLVAAAWKDEDAALDGREEPKWLHPTCCYLSRIEACGTNGEGILQSIIKFRKTTQQRKMVLPVFSQSNASISHAYYFCPNLFFNTNL